METLLKVLAHTVELVCILAITYAVTHWLKLGSTEMQDFITIILAALAKFLRESDKSPVPDYVNDKL